AEIEQDQVRLLLARHADRAGAVGGERGRVAARAQPDVQAHPDVAVVIDDQDLPLRHVQLLQWLSIWVNCSISRAISAAARGPDRPGRRRRSGVPFTRRLTRAAPSSARAESWLRMRAHSDCMPGSSVAATAK